jgi:hypothetical protein
VPRSLGCGWVLQDLLSLTFTTFLPVSSRPLIVYLVHVPPVVLHTAH